MRILRMRILRILRILNEMVKCMSEAFEKYFVDYNSKDSDTYMNSSYKKNYKI